MNNKEKNTDSINNDNEIEVYKVLFEEWKFRQETLWKHMTQFAIVIFFTSTMPITYKALHIGELPQKFNALFFPAVGIVFAVFYVFFCICEATRIQAVDERLNDFLKRNYPHLAKRGLKPFSDRAKKAGKKISPLLEKKMSLWVPIFLGAIEISISVTMIIYICISQNTST